MALLLVAPLVYLRLLGRAVDRRSYARMTLLLALAAALVSVVFMAVVHVAFVLDDPLRQAWSAQTTLVVVASATATCAFVMLVRGSLLRWQIQGFARDVLAVRSGRFDDGHVERISHRLMRERPRSQEPPSIYALNVLFAVGALLNARRFETVEQLLGQLPFAWLTAAQHVTYVNALVVTRFARGDVAGAKSALGYRPDEIEDPQQRSQLDLFEALFASLDGEEERALEVLATIDTDVDPILPHLVRAHALAARGDADGARAALAILKDKDALSVAIEPPGPASKLAEALRSGNEPAYR